tara:strand:+ start:66130 stop:70293 length:4164 start_codon:yes stop_codon:yes gene_type:complete
MTRPIDSPNKRSSDQTVGQPVDPLDAMTADQQRMLLQRLLRRQAESARSFGMSSGQQGLWYAFRRNPDSTAFNVFLPSRIVSELNVDALRSAMNYLVNRHASLRTTFSDANAELKQSVNESLPPEFVVIDASGMNNAELRAEVLAQTQRPFDLESGPLMRMAVFRRNRDDHVVVATTHHIVVDFWSLILLLTELRHVYQCFASGTEPDLPPAPGNYRSFVSEQRAMLDGPGIESQWRHWGRTLDGAPHVLNWFTDYDRPNEFTGRADVVPLQFDQAVASRVKQIASQQSTTTNAVVMAALQVLISRYTREDDFLIGTPFSGRGHRKYENTVGFFVNMLPLRAELSGDPTFAQLVRRVGQTVLKSLEYEATPLAEIVRRIQPVRDPSRSPLFQVTCTFEKSHIREEAGRAGFLMPSEEASANIGGMKQESYYVPHPTCHHDIEFIFEQTETSLQGMICFCRDLFAKESVQRIADNFSSLFQSLCESPDTAVREVSWGDASATSLPRGSVERKETLIEQLESAFQNHGDSPALIGEEAFTFAQLDQQSRKIAGALVEIGIGIGDVVPVCGKRGPQMMIALIGAMRSGAAVVPIDTDQPAVDTETLIEDAGAKAILVDACDVMRLPTDSTATNTCVMSIGDLIDRESVAGEIAVSVSPDDLAYVIYTSGSTGRPKGVMIQHGAIANTMRWRIENVTLSSRDRVLMLLSHQFDAGFAVAMSSLVQGAAIVFPDQGGPFDVHATFDRIKRTGVSVLPAVPSVLNVVVSDPNFRECKSIQQIWSGGESMPSELPAKIRNHSNARIWNFYGPTETAVEATAHEVHLADPRRSVPIGMPIANTEVLVLDDHLKVVPDTCPGQIAIAGRGLAVGYLNQPELTRGCFVDTAGDRSLSSRMYLTGDLGRKRADGQLEFLGRIDQQVKLHGYRIELEEIEHVLQRHSQIKHAAVKVIDPDSDSARLAAYVVVDDVAAGDPSIDLRRHIADYLPVYKRPSSVDIVPHLPIGSSGKVNRNLLPDPLDGEQDRPPAVPPSTPLEQHLADSWAEMLDIESVGVNQNFFELGGSSLQAAMMTARLTDDLGVHVPTSLLFDLADIGAMAKRLVQLHRRVIETRFGSRSTEVYETQASASDTALEIQHPLIAPLKTEGAHDPLFLIHPPGGIVICYRELARFIDKQRPLLAVRSRGLHGEERLPESIETMAAEYVDAIRMVQSSGPYAVGGWSLGGVIAYEVARQLVSSGESVQRLILLDSTIPDAASGGDDSSRVGLEYGIDLSLDQLSQLDEDQQLPFLWQHAVSLGVVDETSPREVVEHVLADLKTLFHHHVQLTSRYQIQPLDVPTLLVRPTDVPVEVKTSIDRGWGKLVNDVDVKFVSGHHHSMVQQPHVNELAKIIDRSI